MSYAMNLVSCYEKFKFLAHEESNAFKQLEAYWHGQLKFKDQKKYQMEYLEKVFTAFEADEEKILHAINQHMFSADGQAKQIVPDAASLTKHMRSALEQVKGMLEFELKLLQAELKHEEFKKKDDAKHEASLKGIKKNATAGFPDRFNDVLMQLIHVDMQDEKLDANLIKYTKAAESLTEKSLTLIKKLLRLIVELGSDLKVPLAKLNKNSGLFIDNKKFLAIWKEFNQVVFEQTDALKFLSKNLQEYLEWNLHGGEFLSKQEYLEKFMHEYLKKYSM